MKSLMTVKFKVIASILTCSILTALVIGFFCINSATSMAEDNAAEIMESKCGVETDSIGVRFDKVEQSVNMLSGVILQGVNFERLKTNDAYVDYYTEQIRGTILNVAENTDGVVSAYLRFNPDFTFPKSGLLYNRHSVEEEFEKAVPTDLSQYDATDTEHVGWYYLPVEKGEACWINPYYDENLGVYMTSYVAPLFIEGEVMGVIGFDVDFNLITQAVADISCYNTGYAFLVLADNTVMYHPQIEAGQNLADAGDNGLAGVADILASDENMGKVVPYQYQGQRKVLVYSVFDNGMKMAITTSEAEINEKANQLMGLIGRGIIVVSLIVCVIGVIVGTSIAKPIKKLTQIIRKTAELDFRSNGEGKALLKRKDEIGMMAHAIGDMREKLREIVNTMSDVQDSITNNVSRLDAVMTETNQIAEDNSATTQQLAAGMQQTEENSSTIITHVDEVKERSHQIFELSQSGKTSTEEVMQRAKNLGTSTVESSEKTLRIFHEMQEKSKDAIEESKAVAQIQELTENIKKISSQTNLLALNANIEAARAGESGRGFAVVATQIGALANQTFQTVDDINNIVEVVTVAVSNMTGCIEMLMDFIEKTVIADYENFKGVGVQYQKDAETVQAVIGGIDESMDLLNKKIGEIATVIAAIGQTVTEATAGITNIAEKSTESVQKTAEGYEQLEESKQSVEELKQVMKKFVL